MTPGERYGVMITPQAATTDSITVLYQSMYNQAYWGENKVPVNITSGTGLQSGYPALQLLVFPNPANQSLILKLPSSSNSISCQGTLLDSRGSVVRDFGSINLLPGETIRLPVNNLAKGLYHLQLNDGHKLTTHKVMLLDN
jgi:hypothetical protein